MILKHLAILVLKMGEIDAIKSVYHFSLQLKFENFNDCILNLVLNRNHVTYQLMALGNDQKYIELCKLLYKRNNINFTSRVAFICDKPNRIQEGKWIPCKIVGFHQNILMWNCI